MKLVLPLLLTAGALLGQSDWPKHNLTFQAGAGLPRAELRNLFANSAGVGGLYGYRFHPWFQVEGGYETLFGAARTRDWVSTAFGDLRIRDYQQFFPFGGRVIVPVLRDRLQFHAGGGGAYIRYSERIRQPMSNYGYRIDCIECTSRDGVGYYGLVGVSVAVDDNQLFRVGFGSKVYRGGTSGEAFGPIPGGDTTDRWIVLYGTLGVSF